MGALCRGWRGGDLYLGFTHRHKESYKYRVPRFCFKEEGKEKETPPPDNYFNFVD